MAKRPFHKRIRPAWRAMYRVLKIDTRSAVFAGAGIHRMLQDWVSRLLTPDQEIKRDARKLRARARDLSRNSAYAKRYLRMVTSNVIGPRGIRLQARMMRGDEYDDENNAKLERMWNAWASKPVTVDGKLTLRRVDKLVARTMACDGETFVRMVVDPSAPFGLLLQPIDADMIDDRLNRDASPGHNEIRMGIEVDAVGRVVGYWVNKKTDSNGIGIYSDRYFIPGDQLIHSYGLERFNQTRGVTWFSAAMVTTHMLDAYEETEAVAARVAAAKMGFFEQDDASMTDDLTTDKTPATMQADPGSFEFLPKGVKLASWSPDHPAAQFGMFVTHLGRKVATSLDVFSNVLMNDAAGVTYSSMRSFGLIERDDWRSIQRDVIEGWRDPLFLAWLQTASVSREWTMPSRDYRLYTDVVHIPRGWSWIDPEKEAKAAILSIQNGLDSRTRILAERGEDMEAVFADLAREQKRAAKHGITISAALPAEVPAAPTDEDRAGGNGTDPDAVHPAVARAADLGVVTDQQ